MAFEIDFTVLKNEKGDIIGFSLIPRPHTKSEIFCDTFPRTLGKKEARMFIEGKELVFNHPAYSCFRENEGAEHRVSLKQKELQAIQRLLGTGQHLLILPDGFLSPGFKVILASEGKNQRGGEGNDNAL